LQKASFLRAKHDLQQVVPANTGSLIPIVILLISQCECCSGAGGVVL
jgi:hypothetical protein